MTISRSEFLLNILTIIHNLFPINASTSFITVTRKAALNVSPLWIRPIFAFQGRLLWINHPPLPPSFPTYHFIYTASTTSHGFFFFFLTWWRKILYRLLFNSLFIVGKFFFLGLFLSVWYFIGYEKNIFFLYVINIFFMLNY